MNETLDTLERAPDPFGLLASMRQTRREGFDALAEELLRSQSRNPGLWRYLAMHFIRAEQYDYAAIAADRHLTHSPQNQEAFLRRYRIALLANDARTAQQMLLEHRHNVSEFQLECSRFLYLQRFTAGLIPIEREFAQLREKSCFAMLRALLRELSTNAADTAEPTGAERQHAAPQFWESLPNTCRFARLAAKLEEVKRVTVLGNGGSLRGSKLGHHIDAQEFVVRINFPKIADFAEDVGTRTDLVFFTEAFLHNLENTRSLQKLRSAYPGVPGLAIDAVRSNRVEDLIFSEDLGGDISLVPIEVRSLLRALSYEFATTGLCCLLLLSTLLRKEIEIYGFDFYSPKTAVHFFSQSSTEAFIGHETAFEKFLVTSNFGRGK